MASEEQQVEMPGRGRFAARASTWVMVAVLALFALMPVITEYLEQPFYLDVSTRLVILAIAAVSLNLILGYGGMISFGHAAFIGIGAYSVGIPFYYDVTNGYLQFALAISVSALYALVTGAICLRTRGVYFIMITLAFAQMIYFALVSMEEYGADDGLSIYERSRFEGLFSIESRDNLYYLCFASLLVVLFLVHRIVHSRFGMAIRGAKGNEERMRAIGFNTYAYRLTCYVISGAICGYAGALLANFTDFISPEMNSWIRSGEFMFMVILGGAGTLFGPFLGAGAFIWLEVFLGQWTTHWRLIFGILLILTVLFARGGINGFIDQAAAMIRARFARSDAEGEGRDG
jgi:branched-chain amino acid transport system permease protein